MSSESASGLRPALVAAAAIGVLVAFAVAGCGGGGEESGHDRGGTGGSTLSTEPETVEPGSGAFVSLASVPKLGLVLVDDDGLTLYEFERDQGSQASCYGKCAQVWPPLRTDGAPQPSNGTSAAKLGTTKRRDGGVQVTYAGRPLYTYAADKRPGEANGNDLSSFGADWYALQGSGAEAER